MDMTEARQQTGPQICDLEHLLLEQFFVGEVNYASHSRRAHTNESLLRV